MTLVYRLSLTTAVYSSGPVTPWMWKSPSLPKNPSEAHIRAVSISSSEPRVSWNAWSPLAQM